MVAIVPAVGDSNANANAIGRYGNRTMPVVAIGDSNAPGLSGVKKVSQVVYQAAVQYPPLDYVAELAVLTLGAKPAEFLFNTQAVMLVSIQITAKQTPSSSLVALSSIQGKVVDQVSEIAMLALARAQPGKRALRCFEFDMDGHTFYVLHLGELGTIVFDTTSKKWAEWKTDLFNNWNCGYGTNWKSFIIGGALQGNMLYTIDPDWPYDDLQTPIVSVITGGYPMRLRNSIACDEIMITSSVGWASTVNAKMQLRTSDDFGMSFRDQGTLDLSNATTKTEVSWRSLGQIDAPGRIFELTDLGGAAQRINSMEMYSRDLKDA